MTDREKILKAAKCCLTGDPMRCPDECPYLIEGFSCGLDPFLADVIAYLNEQEHEPELVKTSNTLDRNEYLWRKCGMCCGALPKDARYCPTCGWRVK